MFFTLPPKFAYVIFALVVYSFLIIVRWQMPECRRQLNVMAFCGGIGGVMISQLYRSDFWNPPSILGFTQGPVYVTIEDFLFGGGFIGLVTILPQFVTGHHLENREETEPLTNRILVVGVTFLVTMAFWLSGVHSLTATSLGFLAGALVLGWCHRDPWFFVVWGAVTSFSLCLVLMIGFIVVVDNWPALADTFCQYCRDVYPVDVVMRLVLWSLAFGALFGPFYAFMASKRYVKD